MAQKGKVGWAQLRVGIVAILALITLGYLIFLLTGDKPFFQDDAVVTTYFDDSAALATGAPVRLNGILIGNVQDLTLSGLQEAGKTIKVQMKIRSAMLKQIPVDSEAIISAENVLGTKYINIKRGKSAQHVADGSTIAAMDTREFDELVQGAYPLLTSMQTILKRVENIVTMVESGQGNIGKFLRDEELYRKLVASVNEIQTLTKALNSDQGTLGKLLYDPALYNEVRGTIKRLDGLVVAMEKGEGTAGKLLKDPALYDDSRKTINELRTLAADLNAGKGTAGKFLKDDELAKEISTTVKRLDGILAKVESGQGTLGQLLVNPSLYENLNGTTAEMKGLMKDFRANPKKFLRIKLGLF